MELEKSWEIIFVSPVVRKFIDSNKYTNEYPDTYLRRVLNIVQKEEPKILTKKKKVSKGLSRIIGKGTR